MFLAVPDMIGWVISAIATNIVLLQSARFISGVAGGGYILCVQVYVGEICSCYHRGWLLSLTSPVTALGVLTMYATSGLLPWHCTAAACCPAPALLVVTIMFYWDSPYWYIHNNNQQCAREALTQFRGQTLCLFFCFYSGTSCVWAVNRLGLVAEAELLKLSSYDVW